MARFCWVLPCTFVRPIGRFRLSPPLSVFQRSIIPVFFDVAHITPSPVPHTTPPTPLPPPTPVINARPGSTGTPPPPPHVTVSPFLEVDAPTSPGYRCKLPNPTPPTLPPGDHQPLSSTKPEPGHPDHSVDGLSVSVVIFLFIGVVSLPPVGSSRNPLEQFVFSSCPARWRAPDFGSSLPFGEKPVQFFFHFGPRVCQRVRSVFAPSIEPGTCGLLKQVCPG